jgi:hypothetical protein
MTYPTIHPDQLACRGCSKFAELDEGEMECLDLISFDGGVPKAPPCFEFHTSFTEALKNHNAIVRQYGENSPEQRRAMALLMDVSPPHILDEIHDIACEIGLMPKASGCLDDGTQMYSLDEIASSLGIPPKEAEKALQEMMAERESLGLSNAGIVTNTHQINAIN